MSRLSLIGRRLAKVWRPAQLCSSREARAKVQSGSLLHFGANVFSQAGDDGIIREVLRRLEVERGFFIEFGAWDGVHLSNTRLLFEKGWSGLFIEGDPARARQLKRRYADFPDVKCMQGFVSPSCDRGTTLDDFCDRAGVDRIDFLSIDIDGLDLNVFETLRRRPTLIAIEGGFSWHPEMTTRVPDAVAAQNLQQPLAVAVESVKSRGYEPICFNQNLYAIDSRFAGKFSDARHDAESLWLDAFFDQSDQFRSRLLQFRRSNRLISRHETPFENQFRLDLGCPTP